MNSKTFRIIDVNINRLMEGLRVVEEVARFVLEDKKLTKKIKQLRTDVKASAGELSRGDEKRIESRNSKFDVGKGLYPRSESVRASIHQIITANIKRCEEAARVLEEFGKLVDPKVGKQFKDIRFEIYEVEKEMYIKGKRSFARTDKLDFDLYVVTDPEVLGKRFPVDVVKQIIKGGAKIVQLRDKKASIGQYYKSAKKIAPICKKAGVTFIVNDYLDVCMAVDADGVHLGQDDIPVSVARKMLGPEKIIGLSTHSRQQALKGVKSSADYISIGPIFETPSKPGKKGLGLEFIKWAAKNIKIPFVAIGGINEKNIKRVIRAGAKRVAVIRAAVGQKDIVVAVRRLNNIIKRVQGAKGA